MSEEEVKQNLISTYVMLLQIKADEKGENPTLEFQIQLVKLRLSSYNLDLDSLEKMILKK